MATVLVILIVPAAAGALSQPRPCRGAAVYVIGELEIQPEIMFHVKHLGKHLLLRALSWQLREDGGTRWSSEAGLGRDRSVVSFG